MKKILLYFITGLVFGLATVSGGLLAGSDEGWMSIYLKSTFSPGEKISAGLNGRSLSTDTVEVTLFKIDFKELMAASTEDNRYIGDLSDLKLKKLDKVDSFKVKVEKENNDSEWFRKEFDVDNPGGGTFIMQAKAGDMIRTRMFMVSSVAAISKSDTEKTLIFVAEKNSGIAVAGANVSILKDKKWTETVTDENGIAEIKGDFQGQFPIVVEWKGSPAAINAYFYSYGYSSDKAYVYTDRPVYRPGQKVKIKGVLRSKLNSDYTLPAEKNVTVIIRDPRGNEEAKLTADLSEYGTYSTEYTLKDEPALGTYNIITKFNNADYYSDFSVEEYRKPEYEISLTPEKDVYVRGDKLKFTVNAKYYFGEPVKDAKVTYTISRRSLYWYWWESGPYSWYYKSRSYNHYSYNGDVIFSGEATTDDKGVCTITFDDTNAENDTTYVVVARVADKSRREVSTTGSVNVYKSGIRLFAQTDKYVAAPGEKVWISTTAKDIYGNPISSAFNMVVNKITWDIDYNRKETKVYSTTIETSSEGTAKTAFTPDEEGYFEIYITGKDGRGNPVSEKAYVYVVKGNDYYSYYSGEGIELLLDKNTYKIGDKAKLLINSKLGDIPVLLTIESDKILDSKVVKLKNGSGFYSFEITRAYQPNVDIAISAIKNDQMQQQSMPLIAPPEDKFLNVTIESDKEIYKPGDIAHVKVISKDENGAPKDTEISLGVVDESIYAVKPETTQDIREFFYGLRGNNVSTNASFWFYTYGDDAIQKSVEDVAAPMAIMERADMGGGMKMKSARAELVEPVIRSDFPDTAYWQAHVRTGSQGVADVTFTMPDTLTTWRLTSRGVTKDTSVGETTYKVISKKNVIIRLETPRFFTQNDKTTVTAVIHNYLTTDKEVTAVLNAKGVKLSESNEKVLTIPAGGDKRVEWNAVVEGPQNAWITVKALTDEDSDAMQLTIPVLPHGSTGGDTQAGMVAEKKEFDLVLPANYIKGTQKLKVNLSSSLTSGMFDIFEYLADYPYGCVEQTMSRFLPDVVVTEALQRAGRAPEGKLKELPKMVADGLNRLADMQHEDGGWGWWKTDETNPYMTAYVIFGLTKAMHADYQVSDDMYTRGVESLKNQVLKIEDFNTKAYMLFALSEAKAADAKQVKNLFSKKNKLSDYGKAALMIACAKLEEKECSSALAKELSKNVIESKTSAHWDSKTFKYSWTDNPVETTAFALIALIEGDSANVLIPKAVMYLNTTRHGDHWYSTKDTALAVMGLTKYMEKFEELKPDYDYDVTINGDKMKAGHMDASSGSGAGVIVEAENLKAGKNHIVINKMGKGNLYYYASLNYFEGIDRIKALDNGIKVERYYSWDEEGTKKVHAGTKLRSGDIIWSQVKIVPRSAYDYVMIADYLPSGFEVDKDKLKDNWYGYWANREIRDEKVVMFNTYMWGNSYSMRTPIRAETPGEIYAMPCTAELMYFPEVGGRSDEARFVVVP